MSPHREVHPGRDAEPGEPSQPADGKIGGAFPGRALGLDGENPALDSTKIGKGDREWIAK